MYLNLSLILLSTFYFLFLTFFIFLIFVIFVISVIICLDNTIQSKASISIININMSLQIQQSQLESITKSQSNSHIKSVTSRHESVQSKQSSITDIVKYQLLAYQDINDQQFVILDFGNQHLNLFHTVEQYSSYMNCHVTEVPIGDKFQASIPSIQNITKYLKEHDRQISRLQQLKIHSPTEGPIFYQNYKDQISNTFGCSRTYEQINQLHINYKKKCEFSSFDEYLGCEQIVDFWQEWFNARSKNICKPKRKRKRIR